MVQALIAAPYGRVHGNLKRQVHLAAQITITAGTPVVTFGPEGFTCTLGATGEYSGTTPTAPKGAMFLQLSGVESDGTDSVELEAFDPAAGTYSFETQGDSDVDDAAEALTCVVYVLMVLEGG